MIRQQYPTSSLSRRALPIAAGFVVVGLAACGGPAPEGEGGPAGLADATAAERSEAFIESVRTVRVATGSIDGLVTASGSLVAPRTTSLAAEVRGRIARVHVQEGDVLAQGAPAFTLEATDYEVALQQAEAGLRLARAEASLQTEEVRRSRVLVDQGVSSQQQLDLLETQLAVADARAAQAEASVARARRDLERTVVRAPYRSSIVERRLHEGATVSGMGGDGDVVLVIQAIEGFEAVLNVPEATPLPVQPGDPATLWVQGEPEPLLAEVRSVNARIDPESRTYSVRVDLGRSSRLKAGSFVRSEITPSTGREGLLIPRDAALQRDGRTLVFRLEGDRVALTRIRPGARGRRALEVLAGLEQGDEVVVGQTIDRLADGASARRAEGSPEQFLPSAEDDLGAPVAAATDDETEIAP